MFEHLDVYRTIVVSGPQRSGTRVCTMMVAHDTGFLAVQEDDYGVKDLESWKNLVKHSKRTVIHSPAMSLWLGSFGDDESIMFIWMLRSLPEILASQNRIGWSEAGEKAKYKDHGVPFSANEPIALIKQRYWRAIQRPGLHHWWEVEYNSLSDHPLWVERQQRRNFGPTQTAAIL